VARGVLHSAPKSSPSACVARSLIPSLAKEGVTVVPAWATLTLGLQALSASERAITGLGHAPACVALDRACPRVPASPKMYPSRTREASDFVETGNNIGPFAGLFGKPSDGLEPSTPSLP